MILVLKHGLNSNFWWFEIGVITLGKPPLKGQLISFPTEIFFRIKKNLTSHEANFFVFQNWKLRFSEKIKQIVIRSFPGCFAIWGSQGEYPSA